MCNLFSSGLFLFPSSGLLLQSCTIIMMSDSSDQLTLDFGGMATYGYIELASFVPSRSRTFGSGTFTPRAAQWR